jgi:hypothetical protein
MGPLAGVSALPVILALLLLLWVPVQKEGWGFCHEFSSATGGSHSEIFHTLKSLQVNYASSSFLCKEALAYLHLEPIGRSMRYSMISGARCSRSLLGTKRGGKGFSSTTGLVSTGVGRTRIELSGNSATNQLPYATFPCRYVMFESLRAASCCRRL